MSILDYREYAALAREAGAEGQVLLKNRENTLPLTAGKTIALFGRTAYDTVYCGTGSGGMVNVPYVVHIAEALAKDYTLNPALHSEYLSWREAHPFDKGEGWAMTPWSQVEMDISADLLAKAAASTDTAVMVIGRTAGEDRDNAASAGAYYLTDLEISLLRRLRQAFPKLIVIMNAGNIIDLAWDLTIDVDSLLYAWQGGCESGNQVADILTGRVNPSGRMPDTVAKHLENYPAHGHFGDGEANYYVEDIYVGYRYFETFAQDAVLYPFGFGLSYTTFALTDSAVVQMDKENFSATCHVTNTGNRAGKTVVMLFTEAPQGELGKPSRVLTSFAKTPLLAPGESCTLTLPFSRCNFASYDDRPGHHAYVLEKGDYHFFIGWDVRRAEATGVYTLAETAILRQLSQQLAPEKPFQVLYPAGSPHSPAYREVTLKAKAAPNNPTSAAVPAAAVPAAAVPTTAVPTTAKSPNHPTEISHNFQEFVDGGISAETFLEQFADEDLVRLETGLGMGPSGVTPGIAGAFGGVSAKLREAGIPLMACSDGPSGIRMDNGAMAFSVPNGTCLAASFNEDLNEKLFALVALECRKNHIESLLGPGMNIHRYPLNGRNFEYFSEDPLLTGRIATAQAKGMASKNVVATVKHFALNSQEFKRTSADAIVSERAAREIYLKGFEIAVTSGEVQSIMTSYNPINGRHAASNPGLTRDILRGEWLYDGIVMTDWWADMNETSYGPSGKTYFASMIEAENDLYMVNSDVENLPFMGEVKASLAKGTATRHDLLRNSANIIHFIRRHAEEYLTYAVEVRNEPAIDNRLQTRLNLGLVRGGESFDLNSVSTERGRTLMLVFTLETQGLYDLVLELSSIGGDVAQMNVAVHLNNLPVHTIPLHGASDRHEYRIPLIMTENPNNFAELFFSQSGVHLYSGKLVLKEERRR